MTHNAEDQPSRSNAGRRGKVLWQFTLSDILSLEINVVQNEWEYQELCPDLRYPTGGSGPRPQDRRQPGDVPASDPIRVMLEEIHGEILRANRLQATRALARAADDGNHPPRGYNGG